MNKNAHNTRNLAISYVFDDVAYGVSEASENCEWMYRIGSDGEWKKITADLFVQMYGDSEIGLSMDESVLQNLIADGAGELELRCEVSRRNTKNGTQTIVIEGIRFADETNREESVG